VSVNIEQLAASQPEILVEYAPLVPRRCEKIGEVAIESGSLLLADALFSDREDTFLDTELTRHIQDQDGRSFVVASTGIGDGRYPVFAEFEELGRFGRRVVALHILCSPDYSFFRDPAFPDAAKRVAEEEEEYLRFMNGDPEPSFSAKAKSISDRSKKTLTLAALDAMADLNAQRPDWLVYLRLNRLVTDEVADPERPDSMIGVVSHGQPIEPGHLFPGLTDGQLRYRLRKLVSGGLLIRRRTSNGYRLAIRFSSASKWRSVSLVSMEHFGWLRKPVQLPLPLSYEQHRKPIAPASLPMAA
jgi:hypothetical protein